MLPTRAPVPMIGTKAGGFRYNRRDIAFDEPFEAVSPQDADILVKARLAKYPPPAQGAASSTSSASSAAATTATDGGARSPTAPNVAAAIRPGEPVRVRAPRGPRAPRKKNTRTDGQGAQASTAQKP